MTIDRSPSGLLPPGRQLAMTWGIPDRYGGMTAALLHRSRAFVREAGATVDVITFDPHPFGPEKTRMLQDRGELIDGMRLRSVWDELDNGTSIPAAAAIPPAGGIRIPPEEIWGSESTVRVWESGGHRVRLEHRAADGRLTLLDERRRSDGPRRLITTFGPDGSPTGQWTDPWEFYADRLDALLGGDRAFAIVDSKTAARFVQSYRRPNLITVHVVHGSHLGGGSAKRLSRARRPVLENAREWDAVVFLTDRQRRDVVEILGDSGNLALVPNTLTLPAEPSWSRDPYRGVIVANLTARKRIDHALQVVAAVRASGAPASLDIVGDGGERQRLEVQVRRLGLDDAVRFHGYVPGAADRYAEASWTLLTSTSEGAPLVLLEAMARGCLPVAYDIRYGPADTIVDGWNGFLVEDADVPAAAAALWRLCSLSDADRADLRRNARGTAVGNSDADVVARWGDVQREALRRKAARARMGAALSQVRVRLLRGRYRVSARVLPEPAHAAIEVELIAPSTEVLVRAPLRRIGSYGVARLSASQSQRLGRGPVRTRFVILTTDGQVALDAGRRHPDPRLFARRALHRARRLLRT